MRITTTVGNHLYPGSVCVTAVPESVTLKYQWITQEMVSPIWDEFLLNGSTYHSFFPLRRLSGLAVEPCKMPIDITKFYPIAAEESIITLQWNLTSMRIVTLRHLEVWFFGSRRIIMSTSHSLDRGVSSNR